MTTRTERLAEAILADRNRPPAERTDIAKCFMCGTGMMYRGTRFCSDHAGISMSPVSPDSSRIGFGRNRSRL